MTARMSEKPTIVDNEGLSDADWAEANRLLRAYDAGGSAAFWRALDELGNADPIRWCSPDVVRKVIRDEIAEQGMTEEDVRELYKKLKQQMDGGSHTKH